MTNNPEYLAILFAIWRAGLVAVPANAKLHARELAYIVENCGARLCLATADIAESLAKRDIAFVLRRFPEHNLIKFCSEVKAALVVGDENPVRIGRRRSARWTASARQSPSSSWPERRYASPAPAARC